MQVFGRNFIYPKQPSGKHYRWRSVVAALLLCCLALLPFVRLNGEQLVLLNVLDRKFVFFGLIFTPQDFYLAAFGMLLFILFVILFTLRFGRMWCGWACPQTIFMEMLFRRIEYWIEGDAASQKKLDSQPWTNKKIVKKLSKHSLFLLVSFGIANIFLAYLIGGDVLLRILVEPPAAHLTGLIAILVFTLVFYFVFAYVREVVCTAVCPYGRLQNVLLDKHSLVVAYNRNRGEPRARHQKTSGQAAGDCVDCSLCVQVCPTGIDIRQGTQLECVNCTACIDACNQVMLKTGRKPSLIGFYSADFLETGKKVKQPFKQYGYAAVLLGGLLIFSAMINQRKPVEVTVLRASGTLYQLRADSSVSNLYSATLINKTNAVIPFDMQVTTPGFRIVYIQKKAPRLGKQQSDNFSFFLVRDKNAPSSGYKTAIGFRLQSGSKTVGKAASTFFSP
ncbi:cytochrome c oxidase accessory protein CcoG [Pedobacter yulinensis]|uniref:Cytochrome c oxidase accessory protein CcoG n=1 Tax=Pedobacter yulinensis TaxID=2126353 RepID=A0A2T3HK05_9SPHI|nr:cytochrome c oxidase accessory protein CcoG [Pedobacter yulinensis]PST82764.1 cytochrome c oxidase accessory protein CcoG [Pedobacter yulinensis]